MSFSTQVFVIVCLTLVNGFFSAAEIGLLSVRRTRLQELTDDGRRAARAALRLRDDPERLLATVQVGITFVGATAGAFGGATMAVPLEAWIAELGGGRFAHELALVIVVVLVSVLSIVLGELVPKSVALRASERTSLLVAQPLVMIARVTGPLVWLLTALSNLVLRPFKDEATFAESRLSPEELQTLVEEASNMGTLLPSVGDIASRAIELGQLPVNSLLIPRREVAFIRIDADRDEAWRVLKETPHSRYPVVTSSLDNIEGYVTARELIAQIVETGAVDVRAVMRELPLVSERTPAIEALRMLQAKRSQVAVVIDEHGMTEGIVTIADMAEELLGDILDEKDRPQPSLRHEADGVVLVRADTPIQDINRALGTELPVSSEYATLNGLLMHASSRIMRAGETIKVEDVRFEVVEATPRQVKVARMYLRPPDGEAAGGEEDEAAT